MPTHAPLQVYACDDLLLLYWPRGEKLAGKLDVLLDGIPLDRPLLGVEFAEHPNYLLVAYAKGISTRKNFSIRIVAPDSSVLAESECQRAVLPAKSLVATWTQETRIRVEKALLVQAARIFPHLASSARAKLAALLAQAAAVTIPGPDGWIYLRLPAIASDQPGLLSAHIRSTAEGTAGHCESVSALLDGGFLHFFGRAWPATWKKDHVWLFDGDDDLCTPFCFPAPKRKDRILAPRDWFAAVLAAYPGSTMVLRGLAALIPDLPGASPEQSSLRGKVQGFRSGWIVGWALDTEHPDTAARLKILADGVEQGMVMAHLPQRGEDTPEILNCGFAWRPDQPAWDDSPHEIRIVSADTGEELEGSPLFWGEGWFDGDFVLDKTGRLTGWAGERTRAENALYVTILIDGESIQDVSAIREIIPEVGQAEARRSRFSESMPHWLFDTHPHTVEIEIRNSSGQRRRLDKQLRVQADYRGHIEIATPERVYGWIINKLAPERPVELDLVINGKVDCSGIAKFQRPNVSPGQESSRCGFWFVLDPPDKEVGSVTVELCISGTQTRVLGPAFLSTPYEIAVRSLITLAQTLNSEAMSELAGGMEYRDDVSSWARTQIIAKLLDELRREKTIPGQLAISLAPTIRLPPRVEKESVVDVIVPVYQGKEDTLRCLQSILAAGCRFPSDLIVINDASPDPELKEELRRLATEHRITLLENQVNLGFVASVNHCMRLHPGRDVVLLNADTLVSGDWLDRLRSTAYSAGNIGTVTPFSNNATICSFPEFCRENPFPDETSAQELDTLFAEINAGCRVDLPTAVGFCMYIKRAALEETGLFDEGRWGLGYGEENDFCLRGANLGWRHVAACDVFVAHRGGVSFGADKEPHLARNLGKLNSMYPDYQATIERFTVQDPLAYYRNRIQLRLLLGQVRVPLLFIIHALGGGTQVAADHLAERLTDEGKSVLELSSITPRHWCLRCHGLPYSLHYRFPADWEILVEDLRSLGILHIHYHQTMHFPKQIWELPQKLGIRYDFTLHDYLPICPRINMIDESGSYCGEVQFSPQSCTRCVRLNGMDHDLDDKYKEFGGDVGHWRAIYHRLLEGARRVFVPSKDAEIRIRKHFDLPNLHCCPHPELRRTVAVGLPPSRNFVVAVIGAIGLSKGYETLLECVCSAEKGGLPIHFSVIGYTQDDAKLLRYRNVSITGAYQAGEIPELITRSGASVALFLSPWPETYCYTLSEAWSAGLFPVALDIGAIGERIRGTGYGELMPLDSSAKHINRVLMRVLERQEYGTKSITLGDDVDNIFREYYGLEHQTEPKTSAA